MRGGIYGGRERKRLEKERNRGEEEKRQERPTVQKREGRSGGGH